ncbi:MAG: hypothetical protein HY038_05920 [Nitrospirae bacterium]|nr:hypothetical protein [Nitrospirota bacterium]
MKFHRPLMLMLLAASNALMVTAKQLINEMAHPIEHVRPGQSPIGRLPQPKT